MSSIEIPEGYMLVPKGGRPKKTARDVAVLMAHLWMSDHLGKGWMADAWVIEHFGLNEASDVRKCRKKAKASLPKKWIAMRIPGGDPKLMMLLTAAAAPGQFPMPVDGAKGWIWAPEFREATEIIARTNKIEESTTQN